jgi:hypothetical protein
VYWGVLSPVNTRKGGYMINRNCGFSSTMELFLLPARRNPIQLTLRVLEEPVKSVKSL